MLPGKLLIQLISMCRHLLIIFLRLLKVLRKMLGGDLFLIQFSSGELETILTHLVFALKFVELGLIVLLELRHLLVPGFFKLPLLSLEFFGDLFHFGFVSRLHLLQKIGMLFLKLVEGVVNLKVLLNRFPSFLDQVNLLSQIILSHLLNSLCLLLRKIGDLFPSLLL